MNVSLARLGLKSPTTKTLAVGIGLILILALVKYLQIRSAMQQKFSPPPETVTSIVTEELSWPKTLSATGSLAAVQGVTLSAEEEGKVTKISFESGDSAAAGQVLLELDTSVEEANLRGAEAMAVQARTGLERAKALRTRNANSQSDLETAEARATETQANVESLKATIARKKIIAPFAGKTGIRMVNLGQYVSKGMEIVPLYASDPLYLDFWVPQGVVHNVSLGQKVNLTSEALSDPIQGTVSAVNPEVDNDTRSVRVQATVPNPSSTLRPGMFAHVAVDFSESEKVIPVPSSSINYAPYGDSVYVIEKMKDPTGQDYLGVRQQIVKLGSKRGNQVAIASGITPGQQIVTSGVFKLRPGAAVVVNNELAPANDPTPHPADT